MSHMSVQLPIPFPVDHTRANKWLNDKYPFWNREDEEFLIAEDAFLAGKMEERFFALQMLTTLEYISYFKRSEIHDEAAVQYCMMTAAAENAALNYRKATGIGEQ